jgi:xylan 1,4-beta-xylosidase
LKSSISNPILPGFHPDPSILRVGQDFYIATSTFEWWPGVRIHHSRDLVHWEHLSYALTRKSQLDMRGNPDSCGIWAPCLSYRDGTFYLVYTNVLSHLGAYKDSPNYIVTAPHPTGPWSEPAYVNSSGFDPSLFHDDDGRSWVVNMQWDHRANHNQFCGILLQEWDLANACVTGEIKRIFTGSSIGLTEGPHLYKRNGWYVLMVAEGGTTYEHAVSIARSRKIDGPYELSPHHPVLTSFKASPQALQRAGHASLVDTEKGEWYLAHLCGRPIEWVDAPPIKAPQTNEEYNDLDLHCILGRETALQRMRWTANDWLVLDAPENSPSNTPLREWPAPDLTKVTYLASPERDDFNDDVLQAHLNGLRVPFNESWISLRERPGYLRLKGRESLMSQFDQSLVARRQQAFDCEAETELEFSPRSFQQMAGLVVYYNTQNHAYLHVTHDDNLGSVLRLSLNDSGALTEPADPIPLQSKLSDVKIRLRVHFTTLSYQFSYFQKDGVWQNVGPAMKTSMLSDEHATRFENGYPRSFGFTGNFIGIACQDLGGTRLHADFDSFSYREIT